MMKRNIMTIAFVAAIALIAGINVYHAQKTVTLSDIAMENVEALAENEGDTNEEPCKKVCYKYDGWMCTRIFNGETSRCLNYRKIVED